MAEIEGMTLVGVESGQRTPQAVFARTFVGFLTRNQLGTENIASTTLVIALEEIPFPYKHNPSCLAAAVHLREQVRRALAYRVSEEAKALRGRGRPRAATTVQADVIQKHIMSLAAMVASEYPDADGSVEGFALDILRHYSQLESPAEDAA